MGVYIKDLKKPEDCDVCPIHLVFINCGCDRDHCMFQEVPEPHGRLIDADAYESLLRGLGDRNYRREKGTICDAIKFLHPYYAPTIIQASEVGE